MFSISCSFSENWAKSSVGVPPLEGWRPLLQGTPDKFIREKQLFLENLQQVFREDIFLLVNFFYLQLVE